MRRDERCGKTGEGARQFNDSKNSDLKRQELLGT